MASCSHDHLALANTRTHALTFTHGDAHIHTRARMCGSERRRTHAHTHAHTHACTHARTHARMHAAASLATGNAELCAALERSLTVLQVKTPLSKLENENDMSNVQRHFGAMESKARRLLMRNALGSAITMLSDPATPKIGGKTPYDMYSPLLPLPTDRRPFFSQCNLSVQPVGAAVGAAVGATGGDSRLRVLFVLESASLGLPRQICGGHRPRCARCAAR